MAARSEPQASEVKRGLRDTLRTIVRAGSCAVRPGLLVALALVALGLASACGRSEGTAAASQPSATGTDPAVDPLPEAAADLPALAPTGLPEDLPIPDGLKAVSVTSDEPGSTIALFTGDLDPDDVARSFAEGLRNSGWSIDESRTGAELGLLARKKQRVTSVVVTRLSGKLHVELGVWAPPPR